MAGRGLFDPVRGPTPASHLHHQKRTIFSITEITSKIRKKIEEGFGAVWVEGEVTNLSRPSSGHLYFTLKDERAQLTSVIWRGVANRIGAGAFKEGDDILAFGKLSVYEPRGAYQLVIDRVELKGLGALQQKFEELKNRLQSEGLFDRAHKRPLPFLPNTIGIVSSPNGAAIHDMLSTIWARRPSAQVVLYPVSVQGANAGGEIARAIRELNNWGGADVLIVGRGGGSLEDLMAFNDEAVARAIFNSKAPVISAVGHEVDTSISDMVADARALTPTHAGDLVVPDEAELAYELEDFEERLYRGCRNRISQEREHLNLTSRSYGLHIPQELIARERQRMDELLLRAHEGAERTLMRAREALASYAGALTGLSPLSVLERGYSVTTLAEDGQNVLDIKDLKMGAKLKTRTKGRVITSSVEAVEGTTDI